MSPTPIPRADEQVDAVVLLVVFQALTLHLFSY